ncbi:unnamed protein product [Rhizoctonia solani]|uniref:Uncharacterized protein n=3 Tax=Rhizoctonia solani TaxID=456999 RepID=A0A8H3HQX5_9AGAM|nr:hypothetical protein RSOL_058250 [Rhizoctonia solani AG-3 Rhs1AP]KEP47966.1 hypothetical protein V565_137990 [Rhizoctonia solani 123E]CAE6379239.1 unnamed protein product [Rhizoctonia solani]CAE6539944.1 unnamed protein product [Rhizoctonia solani]
MAHADPAPSEEDLGEQGYYLDSLRGVHQSLSFMGKPPLFILKDEWEASPPAKEKSYHQILDPRTRAFMKVAKQEEIEIQPVALVQWKVPHAGPGLNALNPKSGEKGPEPEYTIKVAMMNADVMGVGADDEEELDVVSSDDEDGILLRKGKNQVEDDSLTVYYPLIPMPCRHRGKELRKVLSLADENSGAIGRVAMEWLDEIKRVDKFPNIHNEG